MSKKCLVTKLKGAVDNPDVARVGCFYIEIFPDTTPDYTKRSLTFGYKQGEEIVVTVVSGDLKFVDSSGTPIATPTTKTLNSASVTDSLVFSNNHGVIEISNKYNVNIIRNFYPSNWTTPKVFLKDIAYMGVSADSSCRVINADGDVSVLKTFKGLSSFSSYSNTSCYGNVDGVKVVTESGAVVSLNSQNIYGTLTIDPATLGILNIGGSKVNIKPSEVVASTLPDLRMQGNTAVGGTIASYASTSITNIECKNTSISGTVESFLEAKWALSVRSQTVQVQLSQYMTINGIDYVTHGRIKAVFSSDKIVVTNAINNVAINYYDGSSWHEGSPA